MDVLTSSEFRKRYGKLTRDTRVTVNGHVIGTWSPAGAGYVTVAEAKAAVLESAQHVMAERPQHAFNPVPKPSQRRK